MEVLNDPDKARILPESKVRAIACSRHVGHGLLYMLKQFITFPAARTC
jgi:hypothetical protein